MIFLSPFHRYITIVSNITKRENIGRIGTSKDNGGNGKDQGRNGA